MEVAAGLLIPYYIRGVAVGFPNDLGIDEKTYGHSFYLQTKYFLAQIAPEGNYLALQIRNRKYTKNGIKKHHNDLAIMFGAQHVLHDRITIDYNMGVGLYSNVSDYATDSNGDPIDVSIPVSLKIGYILK